METEEQNFIDFIKTNSKITNEDSNSIKKFYEKYKSDVYKAIEDNHNFYEHRDEILVKVGLSSIEALEIIAEKLRSDGYLKIVQYEGSKINGHDLCIDEGNKLTKTKI